MREITVAEFMKIEDKLLKQSENAGKWSEGKRKKYVERVYSFITENPKHYIRSLISAMGRAGGEHAVLPLCELLKTLTSRQTSDDAVAAVNALADIGDKRAVPSLIDVVRYKWKYYERIAAMNALGRIGGREAIGALTETLGDNSPNMRVAAAEALDALGESQWKDIIKGDGLDFARWGETGDLRALKPIMDKLTGRNVKEEDYDNHYGVLVSFGAPALDALINALRANNDYPINSCIIKTLSKMGEAPILPLIEKYRRTHSDIWAYTLGALGDKRAQGPLMETLDSKYGYIRSASAKALLDLGETKWADIYKGDAYDWVRLGETGDTSAAERLMENLVNDNKELSEASARTLEKLGDDVWIKALENNEGCFAVRLIRSGDERIVPYIIKKADTGISREKDAVNTIGWNVSDFTNWAIEMNTAGFRKPQTVDWMIKIFCDYLTCDKLDLSWGERARNVVWEMAKLERLAENAFFDVIGKIRQQGDEVDFVRADIIKIIGVFGRFGNKNAVDTLAQTLNSGSEIVRAASAKALLDIGTVKAARVLEQRLRIRDEYEIKPYYEKLCAKLQKEGHRL